MPALSESRIATLLEPFLTMPAGQGGPSALQPTSMDALMASLGRYLDVLLAWNRRTNLTSIRDPEDIVRRHFGESLFAARCLAEKLHPGATVLDLGSGAGFPGLPLSLLLPELKVTLAESQGKKAAFLREAVRSTGSLATVWSARTETLPSEQRFDAVTLRAVDNNDLAVEEARRLARGGWILQFVTLPTAKGEGEQTPLPGREQSFVRLSHSQD